MGTARVKELEQQCLGVVVTAGTMDCLSGWRLGPRSEVGFHEASLVLSGSGRAGEEPADTPWVSCPLASFGL